MDRSYLSQPQVIAASRAFVCVRLSTYENADEARVLSTFFVGRMGTLENTVFAIVAPDGRTPLVRSGRTPQWAFRDATEMAAEMARISSQYRGASVGGVVIPYVSTVRLALNVAACDHLPLVVLYGPDARALSALEQQMLAVSWQSRLLGRAVYARTTRPADLAHICGQPTKACILVVEPGTFGIDGKVVSAFYPDASLGARLDRALDFRVGAWRDIRQHIDEGRSQGIHWETAIPETDPGPPR